MTGHVTLQFLKIDMRYQNPLGMGPSSPPPSSPLPPGAAPPPPPRDTPNASNRHQRQVRLPGLALMRLSPRLLILPRPPLTIVRPAPVDHPSPLKGPPQWAVFPLHMRGEITTGLEDGSSGEMVISLLWPAVKAEC